MMVCGKKERIICRAMDKIGKLCSCATFIVADCILDKNECGLVGFSRRICLITYLDVQ